MLLQISSTSLQTALLADIKLRHYNILEELTDGLELTDEIKSEIDSAYEEYKETFLANNAEYTEED